MKTVKHNHNFQNIKPLAGRVILRDMDDIQNSTPIGTSVLFLNGLKEKFRGMPDDYGLMQVVAVGHDVTLLTPGQLVVVALHYSMKEIMVQGEVLYDYDTKTDWTAFTNHVTTKGHLRPLPDYIMTRSAPERMGTAITGLHPDSIQIPAYQTTAGIECRWRSTSELDDKAEDVLGLKGIDYRRILGLPPKTEFFRSPTAHVTYEEIVALGSNCKDIGLKKGDLIPVLVEFATDIRFGSKTFRFVRPEFVGMTIDDASILARAPIPPPKTVSNRTPYGTVPNPGKTQNEKSLLRIII